MRYQMVLHPVAGAWHSEQLVLTIQGERISNVEYRPTVGDGQYARRLLISDIDHALQQTARVCPYCSVAHTLAFSMAVEALAGVSPSTHAQAIRVVLAELERAASHLNTLAALVSALGMADAARLSRLETRLRAILLDLLGSYEAALICPGGLVAALPAETLAAAEQSIQKIVPRLIDAAEQTIPRRTLLARMVDVGVLTIAAANQFGLAGPLARASGARADLRVDDPYAAYTVIAPTLVVEDGGDVHARAVVLLLEAIESLRLVARWLNNLPIGTAREEVVLRAGEATVTVEAPRGPLRYTLRSDGQRLTDAQIGIAPQLDRLLARTLLQQAAVDDAMLIAISTDPCTACWQAATYLIGRG